MKYELFGRCVAISGDGDVDISGRPRLGARRDCEAANECTRRTRVVELREDALQCAFDRFSGEVTPPGSLPRHQFGTGAARVTY